MNVPDDTVGDLACLLQHLAELPAILITVVDAQGSVPREPGAWMAVWPDRFVGTVGGGQLEWQAVEWARLQLLQTHEPLQERRWALGPNLGQCCGGSVVLRFERLHPEDCATVAQRLRASVYPVALFGAGHVGQALVRALMPLPFAVQWLDSRDDAWQNMDLNRCQVSTELSDPPQAAVAHLPAGSRVLVMTHSHAQDLDIVAACLLRRRNLQDLPFIGLIGSRTKWAAFRHRLQARGFSEQELAGVTCPIGVPGIAGKHPAVIAAGVAAQLLQTLI